jgi:hypothetical protein
MSFGCADYDGLWLVLLARLVLCLVLCIFGIGRLVKFDHDLNITIF